jgi:hypothetical protein
LAPRGVLPPAGRRAAILHWLRRRPHVTTLPASHAVPHATICAETFVTLPQGMLAYKSRRLLSSREHTTTALSCAIRGPPPSLFPRLIPEPSNPPSISTRTTYSLHAHLLPWLDCLLAGARVPATTAERPPTSSFPA